MRCFDPTPFRPNFELCPNTISNSDSKPYFKMTSKPEIVSEQVESQKQNENVDKEVSLDSYSRLVSKPH